MGRKMTLKARKELVSALKTAYAEADTAEKTKLLDSFIQATGYARKHATRLLNSTENSQRPPRERRREYGDDVHAALVLIWKASNYSCGKRLVPVIRDWITALERHGHLALDPELKDRLLSISAATVDRVLKESRQTIKPRGVRLPRQPNAIRDSIPVRTFGDMDGLKPGDVECDLVLHCGGDLSGQYLHTLTVTDIITGWTECLALSSKEEYEVAAGFKKARELFPFALKSIDTDNGCEFINGVLTEYCRMEGLSFTRSRPYRKNDQAHVEERNGAVVRRFVGHQRLSGLESLSLLRSLYALLRLYLNFFSPSMKLAKKQRGAKPKRLFEPAQTPYQRVLKMSISEDQKRKLQRTFEMLDPLSVLEEINRIRQRLEAAPAADSVRKLKPQTKKESPPIRRSLADRGRKGTKRFIHKFEAQIHRILSQNPRRTPKEVLDLLRDVCDEQINETEHLRVISAEVNAWRHAHPEHTRCYPRGFRAQAMRKFAGTIKEYRPGFGSLQNGSQGDKIDEATEVVRV